MYYQCLVTKRKTGTINVEVRDAHAKQNYLDHTVPAFLAWWKTASVKKEVPAWLTPKLMGFSAIVGEDDGNDSSYRQGPVGDAPSAAAAGTGADSSMLSFDGEAGSGPEGVGGETMESFPDDNSMIDLVSSSDGHNSALSVFADGASVIGSVRGDGDADVDDSDYIQPSQSTVTSEDDMAIASFEDVKDDVVEVTRYQYGAAHTVSYDRPMGMMVAIVGDEPGRLKVGKVTMKYSVPVSTETDEENPMGRAFEEAFEVVFKDGSVCAFGVGDLQDHRILFNVNSQEHPDCKGFDVMI